MAREVVVNCDIHGTPGANEWSFATEGKRWRIDLCPEICEPLLRKEFIDNAREDVSPPVPVGSTPSAARKYGRFVRGLPAPTLDGKG